MDFKLLACSSIAVASFSVLLYDYATFTPGNNAAIELRDARAEIHAPIAMESATPVADNPIVETPALMQQTVHHVTESSHIDVDTPERLRSFEHSTVAGILNPSGLSRSSWTVDSDGPWVSDKPYETQQLIVLLDPGHGGTDPGAIAPNGLREKDLTLDIAKRTREHLKQYPNLEVRFTRDDDTGMSRATRVNKIRQSDADIMISIHFNDLPQKNIALVETYYAGLSNIEDSLSRRNTHYQTLAQDGQIDPDSIRSEFYFTKKSEQLANTLHKHVYGEVEQNNPAAHDAGVKSETLFVLTQSYKTAALMELTCLSHPDEAEKLKTEEYRDHIAKALASGILEYRRQQIKAPMINQPAYTKPASFVNWSPENLNRLSENPHSA